MSAANWTVNYLEFRKLFCIYQSDYGGVSDYMLGNPNKVEKILHDPQFLLNTIRKIATSNGIDLNWPDELELSIKDFRGTSGIEPFDYLISQNKIFLPWPPPLRKDPDNKQEKVEALCGTNQVECPELLKNAHNVDYEKDLRRNLWIRILNLIHRLLFRNEPKYNTLEIRDLLANNNYGDTIKKIPSELHLLRWIFLNH